jgi:hypothetical protein
VVVLLAARWLIVMVGIVEQDGLTVEHQEVPTVRLRQDVTIEDEPRRTMSDKPAVEGEDIAEPLRRAG